MEKQEFYLKGASMKKTGIRPILDRKGGLIGMHGSLPSTSTNSP